MTRIDRLALHGLRGACTPVGIDFDTGKSVVLIFGNNGTGKSTIADAIDFVCNREFGSLKDRSGTNAKQHVVSLNAPAKTLAVELTCGADTWKAGLVSSKPAITAGIGTPPPAFVLRRADIQRVVEQTPKEKYEALKAFITVPYIERAEQALRSAMKRSETDARSALTALDAARGSLDTLWEAEGKPSSDALVWAKAHASSPPAGLKAEIQRHADVLDALTSCRGRANDLRTAQTTLSKASADLRQAEMEWIKAQQQATGHDGALIDVLTEAQHFLTAHPDADACPVCGKPEPAEALQRRIASQLADLSQLAALKQKRDAADSAEQRQNTVLKTCETRLLDSAHVLAKAASALPLKGVDRIMVMDVEIALALIAQVELEQANLDTRRNALQTQLHQLTSVQSHLKTIEEKIDAARTLHLTAQRLATMLMIVEHERKAYVDGVLNHISSTVNDLYRAIHPDEPIGSVSMTLKANVMGSLEMAGVFQGASDVPPAAYYSESHLDTLGLCVYLALAKLNDGNAIIVLDDVLTSVDEVHLERIIQLIDNEATSFGHLIITTHFRAWRDRYRGAQATNAQLIELLPWSLQSGIQHTRDWNYVDELEALLKQGKFERQGVASKAGILLEYLLDWLTIKYHTPVPRSGETAFTLGTLASSANSIKRDLLRITFADTTGAEASVPLRPLIDKAVDRSWVRNQVGCHFNASASGVADAEVRAFANDVLALAKAMICADCGRLPVKNNSGSYWDCGGHCKKRHLYPLSKPD